ncbi:hypothetical protein ASG22_00375 [Chryseobacterium sp. Leaf405]|uniref:hypothetical protein n=1 Tax=Chryseobacterium sp. Leaf405 TaxID=1736367 RepID=UPI0006F44F2A|nr:hypothetical protein [Chryseobacterium sp. Leaf405]KQT35523.1 hypothetical protein ASG22_00375 [Chryseobacterium sp. Leaf405]
MSKLNHEIKENFTFFEKLFTEEKIIFDEVIILKNKVNNKRWSESNSKCSISLEIDDLHLIVEKQKADKKYHIKLRTSKLSQEPFFRFDSDGPAHRNNDDNIPLAEQKVTTPHFNSFNSLGVSIAYKNKVLQDQDQADIILNDINFGMALFCQESNSKLKNNLYPQVLENDLQLDFDYEEMFNFDSLNFD